MCTHCTVLVPQLKKHEKVVYFKQFAAPSINCALLSGKGNILFFNIGKIKLQMRETKA